MATLPKSHHEYWPRERDGYEDRRTVAYAPGEAHRLQVFLHWTAWETRLGSLIVAIGLIWAAAVVTAGSPSLGALWQTPGPLETAAVGLLIWLHAKWQRSVTLR